MEPIYHYVDSLPTDGVTVRALQALDFVAPGQWNNLVGFENTIREVTGETDPSMILQIRERSVELFNDTSQGYQRALWIYQTVDSTDKALGATAMAHKAGEKIPLLGFLSRITPNSDKTQTIDLSVKLVSELVAFCLVNGLPGDSIGDFVQALGAYEKENLIRMAALVCFDGLIPLGPDFLQKITANLGQTGTGDLEGNRTFQAVRSLLPGGDTGGQLSFIGSSIGAVQDWMLSFVRDRGLSPEMVISNLRHYIDVSDDKLDYLAGFLDLTTNYFEHTGTQSLARSLVSRAVSEI
jgi:hypothetical protein